MATTIKWDFIDQLLVCNDEGKVTHRTAMWELSSTACDLVEYFNSKKRVWPTPEDALLFTQTELSEATELILAQEEKGYVRNHPESKEPYSKERFGEELADVIYMTIVSGLVCGVDPLKVLERRLYNERQCKETS